MKLFDYTRKTFILLTLFFILPMNSMGETSSKNNYIIGSEDVLEIIVLGQEELQRTVEVGRNGTISFPMIGEIRAAGQTAYSLEQDIAKRLAAGKYLLHAQVSVKVTKYGSLKAFIFGEVNHPGQYFLKGRTHVFTLLSEAGGLTEDAGREILIIHGNANENESTGSKEISHLDMDEITTGSNQISPYILPGDTVQIPKAPRFYVTGEVRKTGEFKWEKNLSIRRGVAMAGGVAPTGALNRIRIERTVNGETRVIHPEMTDFIMPMDIIVIPQSYF